MGVRFGVVAGVVGLGLAACAEEPDRAGRPGGEEPGASLEGLEAAEVAEEEVARVALTPGCDRPSVRVPPGSVLTIDWSARMVDAAGLPLDLEPAPVRGMLIPLDWPAGADCIHDHPADHSVDEPRTSVLSTGTCDTCTETPVDATRLGEVGGGLLVVQLPGVEVPEEFFLIVDEAVTATRVAL